MILVKPSFEVLSSPDGEEALRLIELAGRTCYKSEDKITGTSAVNFVDKILKSGHHSVIEHANMTVRFICDRGVTHELVRHRLAAYSQESTRYCNYKGGVTFIIPPWVNISPGEYDPCDSDVGAMFDSTPEEVWFKAMCDAEYFYKDLLHEGWSPQQARSVLPNSLKTEIVMTANMREWRHVFKLRCSKAAHPQIREVMQPLLRWCYIHVPVLFDDLAKEYFDGI